MNEAYVTVERWGQFFNEGDADAIASLTERLSKLTADDATAKAHDTDPIAIGGRTYPREDIPDILGGRLDALPKNVR